MANLAPFVIDLVTSSLHPPEVVESGVLPASPILVASTPSHVGNGGSAPEFSHLTQNTTATSPQTMFTTMQRKPKEHPVIMDTIRRISTPGRPWCVTTSHLWGEVTPSKSRIQLLSCMILRMSGILGTNVGTDIHPEIGPSCVTCSSSNSDQISGRKRHSPR